MLFVPGTIRLFHAPRHLENLMALLPCDPFISLGPGGILGEAFRFVTKPERLPHGLPNERHVRFVAGGVRR